MTVLHTPSPTNLLRSRVAGVVLDPTSPGYDEARRVWNGAVDRRPAAIVRCTSAADVAAAVEVAREHGLEIAVRGGGHSIPGFSATDGGVLIDLGPLKETTVDPGRRTVTAGAGVLWAELDAATQEHGLAVTGGEVSHTGIAGLTLGGGIGWLKRTCGLTCDNLLAVEMVTADGRVVHADETEHPDLFWALRGGGGNFGVVTRFTYRLHEVGPMVYGGALVYPAERAADVLRLLREQAAMVPDEVSLMVALVVAPPAPEFPPALRGRPVAVLAAACHADLATGERLLAPLRERSEPAVDLLGPMPYVALQQMVDAANPHGLHYYVKSEWLGGLPDEVIDGLVAQHLARTSPLSQVLLHQMGGAVGRVPRDATAFAFRQAAFVLTVAGAWEPGDDREPHVAWARDTWRAAQPGSLGAAYVNQLDADEGAERVREAYGAATWERLVAVKTAWDPSNVFRLNQNIQPDA